MQSSLRQNMCTTAIKIRTANIYNAYISGFVLRALHIKHLKEGLSNSHNNPIGTYYFSHAK